MRWDHIERAHDISRRTNGWKTERKDHSEHAVPQCRLLRRTMLDMVSDRCIRASYAIGLHLEDLSVSVRNLEKTKCYEPWFIHRCPICKLYERTNCAPELGLSSSTSGEVSRAGTPWYQSSNTDRAATTENKYNLFSGVKRRGAADAAGACEFGSSFIASFDAIFFDPSRWMRQFRLARTQRPRSIGAEATPAFVTDISGQGVSYSQIDHETSLTPADLVPQVGEGPIGSGASNPWRTMYTPRWILSSLDWARRRLALYLATMVSLVPQTADLRRPISRQCLST